jgi:glycosyltransferase 2 family protein
VNRRLAALAAWLIGIALMLALVHRIGTDALWSTLRGVRLGILGVMAAGFAGIAASALPWRLLLPADVRPGVAAAVASRTAAAGLNAVLPLLSVGDVSRLLWIERRAWAHGLAAMAVERLLFALVSGVSVAAGAVAAALLPQLPARFVPAAAGAALLIALLSVVGLWVAARRAPLTALLRWGLKLRAAVGRLSSAQALGGGDIQEVQLDEALRSILGGPRGPLAAALGLHVLARAFFTLEIYAALRALGVAADLPTTLCLAAVPVALSLAAVVIPSQIGVQEGSQAALTAALGLGAPVGLAMTLLLRARLLLTVPIGALCFLLRRRR